MESSAFVTLTPTAQVDFPSEWYDIARADHFWCAWRFCVFRRQLARTGLDVTAPLKVFEIGCANGVVQAALEAMTAWTIDGADLNLVALGQNAARRGTNYLYDVRERRAEFRAAYDAIVLFDVIEHIDNVGGFWPAVLHHLRPGGLVFVNVPALPSMYSMYDEVAGHVRRYTGSTLGAELRAAGLAVHDVRYWGFSLLPLVAARKHLVRRMAREDIIARGFQVPNRALNSALSAWGRFESSVFPWVPLGTSLMATAELRP